MSTRVRQRYKKGDGNLYESPSVTEQQGVPEMSGHATRPGEGSQAVFERIQVSVLPIAGKHATSTSPATSAPPMERQDVDITVRKYIRLTFVNIKL